MKSKFSVIKTSGLADLIQLNNSLMSVAKKTPKFAEGQDMHPWNRGTKIDRETRSNKENYQEPSKLSKPQSGDSQKKKKRQNSQDENWHMPHGPIDSKQMNKQRKSLKSLAENNRLPS